VDAAFAFQATAPTPENHTDIIDKVLGIVGPSEPSQLTEKKRFQLYLVATAGPVPILAEAVGAELANGTTTQRMGAVECIRRTLRQRPRLQRGAPNHHLRDLRYFREDKPLLASGKHGVWPLDGLRSPEHSNSSASDGRRTFSFSSVAGVVGASAISKYLGAAKL